MLVWVLVELSSLPLGYITQERRLKPENTTKSFVRDAKTETADVWLPQASTVSVPVTYGT